jgi:SAM-dependent methyltransferase
LIEYIRTKLKWYARTYNLGRTLEIGSRDEVGGVREFFGHGYDEYIGIDMRSGKGVDTVLNSHDLDLRWGYFDSVVWLETIEHDSRWWLTLENINTVLNPHGFLIVSVPEHRFPEHAYPDDYWRLMPSGFRSLFEGYEILDMDLDNADFGEPHVNTYIGLGRKL